MLRPLQQASPIRWACEALCAAELRGRALTRGVSTDSTQRALRSSLGIFSAKNMGNLLRYGVHVLGSSLRGLGEILIKVGTARQKKRMGVEGPEADRTLTLLNIPDASITKSTVVLGKMLAVHVLIAWVGLTFNKPKRS